VDAENHAATCVHVPVAARVGRIGFRFAKHPFPEFLSTDPDINLSCAWR
jgi:hypothetical protein